MTPEPAILGLKLNVIEIPFMTPIGNLIGASMLCELLRARLSLAGVAHEIGGTGDLNNCRCAFQVSDKRATLAIVEQTLEGLGFKGQSQLCYFDPAETIWRDARSGDALPGMEDFLAETKLAADWDAVRMPALIAAWKSLHKA